MKLLTTLTDGDTKYLTQVAKAGPNGLLSTTLEDITIQEELLIKSPDKTLIHLKGDKAAMWRMPHVHFLLSEKWKKTELETRQAMDQCGWV